MILTLTITMTTHEAAIALDALTRRYWDLKAEADRCDQHGRGPNWGDYRSESSELRSVLDRLRAARDTARQLANHNPPTT